MTAIISLALVLGLLTVSCKKEESTTSPVTVDTSTIDSMNTNSIPPDTTGITTSQNTKDSVTTIKMKDSTGTISK